MSINLAPRLFVAVWPPAFVVEALTELVGRADPRWHVTLRFIGPGDADEIGAGLRSVRMPRPTAVAGPAVERLGRGVVCVPVNGLAELAVAVGYAGGRPFHGHITLARTKERRPALVGEGFSADWPVEEFTLVSSRLHPKGAQYTVLERFPL